MPVQLWQLTGTGWRPLGDGGAPAPDPGSNMLVGAASYHPPLSAKTSYTGYLEPRVSPLVVRRSYQSEAEGIPTTWAASEASIDVGVRASVLSLRPVVAEFNAGTWDVRLRAFLRSIPDDGMPKFLIGWHEADSKVRRGNYTRPEYLTAFRRFSDIVRGEQVPNAYVVPNHTAWLFQDPAKAAGQPEQYWLDDCFDIWSIDAYDSSASVMFGDTVAFARTHNIPWAVAETGKVDNFASPATKATWITDTAAYCSTASSGGWPAAVFYCWFDAAVGFDPAVEAEAYTPTSNAASIAAANTVAAAYYRDPRTLILP